MITLQLLDKDMLEVKTLEVEPKLVVDAACIIHEGRYYIYANQHGRAFSVTKFIEVNPPVTV